MANGGGVSVLLGDGSGSFVTSFTQFFFEGGGLSVVVGDFNGDENEDLATYRNIGDGLNFVVNSFLGDGSGGFSSGGSSGVVGGLGSMAVGDFNGDGKEDLAVPSEQSNNVSVLLGDGSGGFAPQTTFAVGNSPRSVAVGDFDGDGNSDLASANGNSNNVSVLINKTDEVPTITTAATASVLENQTSAIDVNTTDDFDSEGGGLTYNLSGGADVNLFAITNIGEVIFINAPDFELPGDANGDNNYEFQVTVTDSGGLTDSQEITITVTDELENTNPTITSAITANVLENQTSAIDVNTIDDNDSEGNGLTYSLSGGEDVSLFAITNIGEVIFINAPDFELPGDANGDNNYEFQVTVTDSEGLSDSQEITITVTDEVENTAPTISLDTNVSILENGLATLTGTITDPDVSDTFTLTLDWGDPPSPNNTETFNFDSSSTVSQTFSLEHQYLDDNPSDTASDTYIIQATVTDNNQETGSDTQELTVNNVAPSFGELTVTSVFIDDDDGDDGEGLSITIEGTFTDPGSLDLHNGTATWSDGFSGGFEEITLGERSFIITRFLSEDQLKDNFPEIDDDTVRIGIDISLFDDDLGTDTTTFEFEVFTDD